MNSKTSGDIYRNIYTNSTASRQSIAYDLDISLPTLVKGLEYLVRKKLIQNSGVFDSTGGRKANMYSIVPDAHLALGIDITASHIAFVIVDLRLNLICKERIRYAFRDDKECFKLIHDTINKLLKDNHIDKDKILGTGISFPAIISADQKKISFCNILDVSDKLYDNMMPYMDYPFLFFNDSNSGGWAESWMSDGNKPIIYLSLSNSVGGALVTNKELYYGDNCKACEFGHMCIVPNGKLCYCGQHGCLDAYCNAKVLTDFTNGDIRKFFDILDDDSNIGIRELFHDYMEYLSIAVANLRLCYDCDVILGGYVGSYMENYIDEFRKMVDSRNSYDNSADYVRACKYKNEASAVGAALYYINSFIMSL